MLKKFIYNGKIVFDSGFFTQWLSSVSISLAIYAFIEKFIPSKGKILSEAEINSNKDVVEEIKSLINSENVSSATNNESSNILSEKEADEQSEKLTKSKKIILINK